MLSTEEKVSGALLVTGAIAVVTVGLVALARRYIRNGGVFKSFTSAPTDVDMTGKVCVITGANTGIGKQTALGLAKLGATVYIACRDIKKGTQAKEEIISLTGNHSVHVLVLDLFQQVSIKNFVEQLERLEPDGIDVLINNAGMATTGDNTDANNILTTFTTNHLGPFRLTQLLLPSLQKRGTQEHKARIVMVSSRAGEMVKFDPNDIDGKNRMSFNRYATSKMANSMFAMELADRLQSDNVPVTCNFLCPGWVKSEIDRNGNVLLRLIHGGLVSLMGKTTWQGAQTSITLAADPALNNTNGQFFEFCARATYYNPACHDKAARRQLYDISNSLCEQLEQAE